MKKLLIPALLCMILSCEKDEEKPEVKQTPVTEQPNIEKEVVTACGKSSSEAVVVGEAITFTNCSDNDTCVTWYFGDGKTSSDENPTHSYDTSGTFPIMLISSNPNSEDTAYMSVRVTNKPDQYALDYLCNKTWEYYWYQCDNIYCSDSTKISSIFKFYKAGKVFEHQRVPYYFDTTWNYKVNLNELYIARKIKGRDLDYKYSLKNLCDTSFDAAWVAYSNYSTGGVFKPNGDTIYYHYTIKAK